MENLQSMYTKLEEKIANLKADDKYDFKLQKYNKECGFPSVLAIITPLMKRVHSMVGLQSSILYFICMGSVFFNPGQSVG